MFRSYHCGGGRKSHNTSALKGDPKFCFISGKMSLKIELRNKIYLEF